MTHELPFDPGMSDVLYAVKDFVTDPVFGLLLVCTFVGWLATRKGPAMKDGPR